MKEQEFKKLLKKYLVESISEGDKLVINKFEEELSSLDVGPNFKSETDKSDVKNAIWAGVLSKLVPKTPILNWKVLSSSAAILVGFLVAGYFYLQNTSVLYHKDIRGNSITLQLEDGSFRIIEEHSSATLTNNKGAILGQQKGNQLIYSQSESAEELVYNTLIVPYGKTFELSLSDGTKVHLNSGTSIKYPVKFLKGQERNVYMTGEAFLDVAEDSLRPFIVNTDDINILVLGTNFNVSSYPEDETSEVVLVKGSIKMYGDKENLDRSGAVMLKPGYKGSFSKNSKEISKEAVITSLYTSWMNGELILRNMTFSNIVKKLERHYNVTIVNKNEALASKKFNANFGDEPLRKVLQELKLNYGIDYKINDKGDVTITDNQTNN